MSQSPDFTLVTYSGLPELDPDDRLLLFALTARGFTVSTAIWNDPSVDWASAGTSVIRSTWDYHEHYPSFVDWVGQFTIRGRLVNHPSLVRWNSRKTYLEDLAGRGVDIVPTVFVKDRGRSLRSISERTGWTDLVLKPVVGLSTSNVRRVRADGTKEMEAGERHLQSLLEHDVAMVQPYCPAVATTGERALVFLGGQFSHAIRKAPFQKLATAGDAGECQVVPEPDEVAIGRKIVERVDPKPTYARVDLVRGEDGRPLLMELELIEPSLFLTLGPGAADRLAVILAGEHPRNTN